MTPWPFAGRATRFAPGGRTAVALTLAGIAAACGSSTSDVPAPITELPRALTVAENRVLDSSADFGFRLLAQVARESPGENVFLSPLSASMALGIALHGASDGTFEGMRIALGLGALPADEIGPAYEGLLDLLVDLDPAVGVRLANAVWLRDGFRPEPGFLDDAASHFRARVQALDFASSEAASIMNEWVREQTQGRIDRIVEPPIDPLTVAFLMNAVHFDAGWTKRFDPERTRMEPFHTPSGEVTVPLMRRTDSYRRARTATADAIELDYGGGAFAMTVMLPGDGRSTAEVVDALAAGEWRTVVESLAPSEVTLRLPKFQLEDDQELQTPLTRMGMADAFDPARADFRRMDRRALELQLHLSRVRQKTFVRVDERGTEAAAATSVEVGVTSAPQEFRVDRPFVLVIRERLSGAVLFAGVVVRPEVPFS